MNSTPCVTLAAAPDWLAQPLCLRSGLQALPGLDGLPLLYDETQRRYVALSHAAAQVLDLLDGTCSGAQLLATVPAPRRKELLAFLDALRCAGLLTGLSAAPAAPTPWLQWLLAREHLLRWPLVRNLSPLLAPLDRVWRAVPKPLLIPLVLVTYTLWVSCIVWALWRGPAGWSALMGWLIPLFLLQAAVHELAHAWVCQHYGVPVREAGVGLLFFVIPVGYVDRTDAYRLTQRHQRVWVALAGPLNDLAWAGLYAIVALAAQGAAADLAWMGMAGALLVLVGNLNPFLPTDGFRACEAAIGAINLRQNSILGLLGLGGRPQPKWRTALALFWLVYLGLTLSLIAHHAWSFLS